MPDAVKVPKRKSIHTESEEDDIATGIIRGLRDDKERWFTRLKNADDLRRITFAILDRDGLSDHSYVLF